jgi:hypothetical protein
VKGAGAHEPCAGHAKRPQHAITQIWLGCANLIVPFCMGKALYQINELHESLSCFELHPSKPAES